MNKTITAKKIGEDQVHVTYDQEGKIRVNLYELCIALKRGDLFRSEEAMRICPSRLKIAFRKNGKEAWSIRPADIHALLKPVWRDSILPYNTLKEVEDWANELIESEHPLIHKSQPVVVSYKNNFSVTFQIIGDRAMVNTTQITIPFGKLPSEWLRIASTDNLRRDMEKAGITGPYNKQLFTVRGRGKGATWIEAPLAIALARWISPQTDLADWCASQVEKLQKEGGQIFTRRPIRTKQIVRHPALDVPLPDNLEDAHKLISELRQIVEGYTPQIKFYEEFIENRDWFKSTRIADELKITPFQLHQFLEEEGICYRKKGGLEVFNQYRAWQCIVPYTWTSNTGKTYKIGSSRRWTQLGRECIIELWIQKHPESQF